MGAGGDGQVHYMEFAKSFGTQQTAVPEGQFRWPISKSVVLLDDKELMDKAHPARQVMDALAEAVVVGDGRVDLLACSLLKSREGKEVFQMIERETQVNFAASVDKTGNPKDGGDWVMESDDVDIRDMYFLNTEKFDSTFATGETKPTTAVVPDADTKKQEAAATAAAKTAADVKTAADAAAAKHAVDKKAAADKKTAADKAAADKVTMAKKAADKKSAAGASAASASASASAADGKPTVEPKGNQSVTPAVKAADEKPVKKNALWQHTTKGMVTMSNAVAAATTGLANLPEMTLVKVPTRSVISSIAMASKLIGLASRAKSTEIAEPVTNSIGLKLEGDFSKLTPDKEQKMKAEIKQQIAKHLGIAAELIPDEAITLSAGSIIPMIDIGLLRKLNPGVKISDASVAATRSAIAKGQVSVKVDGEKQSAKPGDLSGISYDKAMQKLQENRAKPGVVSLLHIADRTNFESQAQQHQAGVSTKWSIKDPAVWWTHDGGPTLFVQGLVVATVLLAVYGVACSDNAVFRALSIIVIVAVDVFVMVNWSWRRSDQKRKALLANAAENSPYNPLLIGLSSMRQHQIVRVAAAKLNEAEVAILIEIDGSLH